jgi:hypothetical protein
LFPSEDIRLEAGNRLVVLATMEGLQNAEYGMTAARNYQVRILGVKTDQFLFNGVRTLSRVTGCKLAVARELMANLPATTDRLFRHLADRLVRELGVEGVNAELAPVETTPARSGA